MLEGYLGDNIFEIEVFIDRLEDDDGGFNVKCKFEAECPEKETANSPGRGFDIYMIDMKIPTGKALFKKDTDYISKYCYDHAFSELTGHDCYQDDNKYYD